MRMGCDRKVQTQEDDGEQEDDINKAADQQGFLQHRSLREAVVERKVRNMAFDQIGFGERYHWATNGIQIGVHQLIGQSADGVGRGQPNVTGSLRQNNLDGGLIDGHIVVDVIDEVHLQLVLVAIVEHVLVRGHIVAQSVLRFPAAEEREARTQLQLDEVAHGVHVGGGNVAIGVAVIDTRCGCRQVGLVRLEGGQSGPSFLLQIVARERALQLGPGVRHLNRLLDGNVAPMRYLQRTFQRIDGDEWCGVLIVDD